MKCAPAPSRALRPSSSPSFPDRDRKQRPLRSDLVRGGAIIFFGLAVNAQAQHAAPAQSRHAAPPSIPENSAKAIVLPAITVTSPPIGSLTVPSVAQQKREIDQTAGSVDFIDSESFGDRYTANLDDVLKDAPGVSVAARYGQELRLSIRGSGIARAYHTRGIEILQDGIPTNLADGSGDYYQIDPLALRSVDIYKGGNGLAYGSSMLGGAINFVTPTAHTAVAPNILRLHGGSFGTMQANGQVSRILGNLDFMANFTTTHADGYWQHEAGQYEQFNANIGYRIGPNVETRFYVGAYVVDQLLPGTLTLDDALKRPQSAQASAVALDEARNTHVERFANRTTFAFDTGILDIDTWVIHKQIDHPIFQILDQDGVTYGIASRYTTKFTVGGHRDELILGGRFFGGNNTALRFVNDAGSKAEQTLDSRQNAYNYEGYFENRLFVLPRLALMAGAKLLHDERHYIDNGGLAADPVAKSASRSYNGFNPKIGLLWNPRPDIQVFADVTRSQDVPDFTDLTQTIGTTGAFVPLQAQRAWTAEIGTRGKHHRFSWDVTLYRSWLRDELMQYTTDSNIPASTFNAGNTLHQGIELGASVELLRNISGPQAGDKIMLSQLWNWSDFTFRGDPQYGNNRIPGVPRNVLRTTVAYTRPDGFYFSPSIDWVPGGAWADYANTLKVPGYALFGLETGVNFSNGWSVYLEARNLADERYVSDFGPVTDAQTTNTAVFYPGAGRSVFVGLRHIF